MPNIYVTEYACEACGNQWEVEQHEGDDLQIGSTCAICRTAGSLQEGRLHRLAENWLEEVYADQHSLEPVQEFDQAEGTVENNHEAVYQGSWFAEAVA